MLKPDRIPSAPSLHVFGPLTQVEFLGPESNAMIFRIDDVDGYLSVFVGLDKNQDAQRIADGFNHIIAAEAIGRALTELKVAF